MDPNEALKNLREAMADQREALEKGSDGPDLFEAAARATEAFEALDEWLSKDGFLPADWLADEDKPWHARADS